MPRSTKAEAVAQYKEKIPPLHEIKAEKCRRSFYYFLQEFWDVVIPEKAVWNWHLKYLCDELQYVQTQWIEPRKPKEYDLIINIPPGSTKSTICSEMFPIWVWTRDAVIRSIVGSYAEKLGLDLALKSRDIVNSDKFKLYFPNIKIREDLKQKSHFKNTEGGERLTTSILGSVTGMHGHYLIIDDPINPMDADAVSGVNLGNVNEWIEGTLLSRHVDPKVTTMIMVMQRLHQDDPTGFMLGKTKKKIKHICIPAEESDLVNPPELRDKYVNGFMDPVRLDQETLDEKMEDYGSRKYSGQMAQNPIAKGGNAFDTKQLNYCDEAPYKILKQVRYWDKAGTQNNRKRGAAHTAGVLLGEMPNKRVIVLDVVRGSWDARRREPHIRNTAELDGHSVKIWVEQEPGSGGKESVETTISETLAGFRAYSDKVSGSKDARAEPLSIAVENGKVWVLRRAWTREFVAEMRGFPLAKQRDQVDAAGGAYNKLNAKKRVGGALRRKK